MFDITDEQNHVRMQFLKGMLLNIDLKLFIHTDSFRFYNISHTNAGDDTFQEFFQFI